MVIFANYLIFQIGLWKENALKNESIVIKRIYDKENDQITYRLSRHLTVTTKLVNINL